MRGSLEIMVGAGWLLIAACGGGDDDGATTPAATCTVDVRGGGADEQVITQLDAAGLPLETTMSRGGQAVSRWTYAYDDAGQLLVETQDPGGQRLLRHTTTETEVSWAGADGMVAETVVYTLDAAGRVTGYDGEAMQQTFRLGDDGRIEQLDLAAVDPDDGTAYTTVRRYGHDVSGLLAWETVNDSRAGGIEVRVDYANATLPGQLVVQRSGGALRSRYTYDHDAQGRVIRAEADEDGDGNGDWVVDVTHAADGAVTTIGQRDGVVGWTHTFSAGCGFDLDVPHAPRAGTRPGPQWQFAIPAVPAPY